METTNLSIKLLQCNEGQVDGLPRNPRFIKDERFEKLKKSLHDDPEMLSLRELIVYPHNGKYVVIGGNMRLRAAKQLGFKEMPCKVLAEDTPIEKLKAYVIKDNNAFGNDDFDLLANEWDVEFLEDMGMEFGQFYDNSDSDKENKGSLPPELQGLDINPDELEKITGDNETLVERIIITYKKEEQPLLESLLGVPITKVLYNISELNGR